MRKPIGQTEGVGEGRRGGGGKRAAGRGGKVRTRRQRGGGRGGSGSAGSAGSASRAEGRPRQAGKTAGVPGARLAERGRGHFSRWLGVGPERKLHPKAARKTKRSRKTREGKEVLKNTESHAWVPLNSQRQEQQGGSLGCSYSDAGAVRAADEV